MENLKAKKNLLIAMTIIIFGLATVASGWMALFTEAGIETRGDIVPLVLWFNFLAGFLYILAGVFSFKMKTCSKRLAIVLAVASTLALAYLLNHIYQGGLYESRTLVAMGFRTLFWISIAVYL